MNSKGCLHLIEAIFIQARKDYVNAKRHRKQYTINEIVRFLDSEWRYAMCQEPTERIIAAWNSEFEERKGKRKDARCSN